MEETNEYTSERIKEFNKKWEGKRVLIIGDHPHEGEVATVIGMERLGIGGYAVRVKGEDNEFFVFSGKDWKLLI